MCFRCAIGCHCWDRKQEAVLPSTEIFVQSNLMCPEIFRVYPPSCFQNRKRQPIAQRLYGAGERRVEGICAQFVPFLQVKPSRRKTSNLYDSLLRTTKEEGTRKAQGLENLLASNSIFPEAWGEAGAGRGVDQKWGAMAWEVYLKDLTPPRAAQICNPKGGNQEFKLINLKNLVAIAAKSWKICL